MRSLNWILSTPGDCKMKNRTLIEKQAESIADAIVDLVERTDDPVTLARVEREIAGFAQNDPAWEHVVNSATREMLVWDGMTKEGAAALQKVIHGHRVAIQFVTEMLYLLLQDRMLNDERWWPIVLLPTKAANWKTPNWLILASERQGKYFAKSAAEQKKGYRLLTPGAVGVKSDLLVL